MEIVKNKIKNLNYIVTFVFIVTTILWLIFVFSTKHSALYEGPIFEYILKPFLIGMTLLPIIGGILGFYRSKEWGGWQSKMGRALIAISLGLFGWGSGMIFWNYYLFFMDVEVPYPSLGDLFYVMTWPFWTYAMLCLFKVTGANYGFKKSGGKILAFILPIIVVLVSYYLLFQVARQGQLDLSGGLASNLLAFLYPIGDVSILLMSALVFSLSYKFLGGVYRKPILILLLGFVLNYIADVVFVFTTTTDTYFNGHFVDFLYVVMLFTVSMGISKLSPTLLDSQENNS
ncbi:MAG: hypothetical protein Q8O46_05335 [bacterium]|nr:hypothetical protein [bacterium]